MTLLRSVLSLDQAEALFASAAFVAWWGMRVKSVDFGTATVVLPSAPHLIRPGNVLHGATYEVAADAAMWLAIATRLGPDAHVVTVEMKTNFLRSTGTSLHSTATVLRLGRRMIFGTAETLDDQGRLVAYSSLTYTHLEAPAASIDSAG